MGAARRGRRGCRDRRWRAAAPADAAGGRAALIEVDVIGCGTVRPPPSRRSWPAPGRRRPVRRARLRGRVAGAVRAGRLHRRQACRRRARPGAGGGPDRHRRQRHRRVARVDPHPDAGPDGAALPVADLVAGQRIGRVIEPEEISTVVLSCCGPQGAPAQRQRRARRRRVQRMTLPKLLAPGSLTDSRSPLRLLSANDRTAVHRPVNCGLGGWPGAGSNRRPSDFQE